MKIGFLGFGTVAKRLTAILDDCTITTIDKGRSRKTKENIKSSNVETVNSFDDVDIIFSTTTPKESLNNAKKHGKNFKGIYIDLNNISPKTALKINNIIPNFVDASIIGHISNDFTLFLSGPNAHKLKFLNRYFPVKIISNNIGDASKLKILRSIYTKSLSAILIETIAIADKYNLREELLETLTITEGENFKESALSRVENTLNNNKRKSEELIEILDYFPDENLEMVRGALKKLSK